MLSPALSERYRSKTAITELFVDADDRVVLDLKLGGMVTNPRLSYDASETASRAGVKAVESLLETIEQGGTARDLLNDLFGRPKGKKENEPGG